MKKPAGIVFKAIADPTRRRILELLAVSPCSVKELTESFPISQPAISQHLRELRDAQLVAAEKMGLERRYRFTGAPLREVFEWTARYKRFFDPTGHAWSFGPGGKDSSRSFGSKRKGGQRDGN